MAKKEKEEKEESVAEPVWGAAVSEEKEEAKPELTEKEKMLVRIQEILGEHNGMESNIPVSHEYWDLTNRYRGL